MRCLPIRTKKENFQETWIILLWINPETHVLLMGCISTIIKVTILTTQIDLKFLNRFWTLRAWPNSTQKMHQTSMVCLYFSPSLFLEPIKNCCPWWGSNHQTLRHGSEMLTARPPCHPLLWLVKLHSACQRGNHMVAILVLAFFFDSTNIQTK